MKKYKKFNIVYNNQLFTHLLNEFTNEVFTYNDEFDLYESENFEVAEIALGIFSLVRLSYDQDTGGYNDFEISTDERLADIIDLINKNNNDLK